MKVPLLGFRESVALATRYGLPAVIGTPAKTEEEAAHAAERIDAPVALKVLSAKYPHKKRAGLVRLDVFGKEEARKASRELLAAAGSAEECEGVLVQPMVRGGIELFLGGMVDPQFGPIVAFGPGGTLVEYLGGVDFLRPPECAAHLRMFIRRNAVYPLIAQETDRLRAREGILLDCLTGIARLMLDRARKVRAIDINPLILSEASAQAIVVDLRIEGEEDDGDDEN